MSSPENHQNIDSSKPLFAPALPPVPKESVVGQKRRCPAIAPPIPTKRAVARVENLRSALSASLPCSTPSEPPSQKYSTYNKRPRHQITPVISLSTSPGGISLGAESSLSPPPPEMNSEELEALEPSPKSCTNPSSKAHIPECTPPNSTSPPSSKRETCTRCARPKRVCICFALPKAPLQTRTHVIIIQSAAEAKAKVRTGDLAPLVLANSRLLPAVAETYKAIPPDSILLYPGLDAVPLPRVADPGRPIILLDGTWDSANRIYTRSPKLQKLQRAFIPGRFLGEALFLARKPPQQRIKDARSTAEAVAGAILCIEGEKAAAAVEALRRCVHESSEMQLQFVRRKGPTAGRHREDRQGYIKGLYEDEEEIQSR